MLLDLDQLVEKYSMNIKGVIHIGAHFGQEFDLFIRNGAKEVMMFEPQSEVFRILSEKFQNESRAILENCALGSSRCEKEMYTESNNQGQSSSLLKPKKHITQYPNIRFTGKETVRVDKLDNFNTEGFNMIDIDVQGYELEVFKGSLYTLKHIDYIITEVNREELYDKCAMVDSLDRFLSFYKFRRCETDWAGQT